MNALLMFIAVIISGWAILNMIYNYRRELFLEKGFKLYYGLVLVYKKKKSLKEFRLLRKISVAFIVLFIIVSLFFYYSMTMGLMARIGLASRELQPQLLVPGINIRGDNILYFILMVVIAAVVHEYAHAYIARSHGINVKSLGFAIILFVPIAFTEINEEDASKSPLTSKISMLSAGPVSNFLLGLLFMYLFMQVVSPVGLVVNDVEPGSLADKYGIKPYTVILSINQTPATLDAVARYFHNNKSSTVILTIIDPETSRLEKLTIYKPANTSLLGVVLWPKPADQIIGFTGIIIAVAISKILFWGFIVNMGLALINAAPLFITDGGRIVYEAFGKNIGNIVNVFTLILLILAVTVP